MFQNQKHYGTANQQNFSKYQELLPKFRNPKIKKSRLWKEMETEMKELGYPKLNAHSIDRKIRNMKSTYKRIKNNKKKTGRGREDWEFYAEMDEIFNADKSVNFEEGISSMESGQNPFHEAIDFSKRRFSLPNLTLPFQHFNDINNCKFFSNYIDFVSSSYDASDRVSDSDIESSMEGPSNSIMLDEYSTSNTDSTFHDASTRDSNEDISLSRRKLCSQRNKIIELESKKINILQNMEKKSMFERLNYKTNRRSYNSTTRKK